MKLLILGHGDHGKDEAAEIIERTFGLSFTSSSRAACEKAVFPIMRVTHGYSTPEACYADRGNHRLEWKELISFYNTPDKARLVKEVLTEHDTYVGLRCDLEYAAAKELFDVIIWIDASLRKPLEPTMKIAFDPEYMIRIDNNGDICYLTTQLEALELC